jgi:hypothetical protein
VPDSPAPTGSPVHGDPNTAAVDVDPFPDWFTDFLNDRQTRKPSAHTMKAYRQDFIAIARLVIDGDPSRLAVTDITRETMRTAFAIRGLYADAPGFGIFGWPAPQTYRGVATD